MKYLIGMDIGGSNIRLGAVNAADNSLIGRCSVLSSDVLAGCADPAEVIFRLICDHLKEQGLAKEELRGIGIGIPGSVFHDFSTVNEVPNIPGNHFRGLNLGKELGKKLKKPVFVDKDVNLLLRADMHILDLSGTVLAVYIGTGIGMAVSINGEILYGTDGFAMDAGHMPVYHAEGICGCGKKGCAETIGSGRILQKLQNTFFPDTGTGELFTLHRDTPQLKKFVEDAAYVPAVLVTVFNPTVCILGGGVVEMADFPRDIFENHILSLAGRAVAGTGFPFVYPEKDDTKGVVGAAIFAEEQLSRIHTKQNEEN